MRVATWALTFSVVGLVACGEKSGTSSSPNAGGNAGSAGSAGSGTAGSSAGSGGSKANAGAGGGGGSLAGSGAGGGRAGSAAGGGGGDSEVFLGGEVEPLEWSQVDVLDGNGEYPDTLPDGKGGLHVVAHSTNAKLLNYSTAGWVVGAQYSASTGSPKVVGAAASPLVAWREQTTVESVAFDGQAFGDTQTVGDLTNSFPGDFTVVGSSSGDSALALYSDDTSVWASRLKSGTWSGFEIVGTAPNDGIARVAKGAMDDQGRAVVLWHQQDGVEGFNDRAAWAAVFDGNAWQPSAMVGSDKTADLLGVAVNRAGKGFAAWGATHLFVRAFDLAVGFGETVALPDEPNWFADQPAVAVNAAGDALVVYVHQKQFENVPKVKASFHAAGSGWTEPLLLEGNRGISEYATATLDDQGRGAVAWISSFGKVYVVTYGSAGFMRTTRLYEGPDEHLREIEVAISGDTAYVVWGGADEKGKGKLYGSHAPFALP